MIVTIKGEANNAKFRGIPGIYVLGPNFINGRSHWLQESGSNAIWNIKGKFFYKGKERYWTAWGIGSQDDIGSTDTDLTSVNDRAGPQKPSYWRSWNSEESDFIKHYDILVQSGTCIHHTKRTTYVIHTSLTVHISK